MKKIKVSKNLYLHEYMPKDLYCEKEAADKLRHLERILPKQLVQADQMLRDEFGPVTINNWMIGLDRQWSGLRTHESPYFSQTSMHTYCGASDKLFSDADPEKVNEYIKRHYRTLGITCIEIDKSWNHSDIRNYNGLLLVTK